MTGTAVNMLYFALSKNVLKKALIWNDSSHVSFVEGLILYDRVALLLVQCGVKAKAIIIIITTNLF